MYVAWLKEYKQLTYFVTQNLVFCFYCKLAAIRGLLSFSKNASDAFVTKGFNNWKKAKERFQEHEQSHAHSEACVKISALKQPSSAEYQNYDGLGKAKESFTKAIRLSSVSYMSGNSCSRSS